MPESMQESAGPAKLKFLEQVRAILRIEEVYVGWIRRYILFHGKRHPREMGKAGTGVGAVNLNTS
jgi:hypothetical protein